MEDVRRHDVPAAAARPRGRGRDAPAAHHLRRRLGAAADHPFLQSLRDDHRQERPEQPFPLGRSPWGFVAVLGLRAGDRHLADDRPGGVIVPALQRGSADLDAITTSTTRPFFTERAPIAALPNTVVLAVATALLCVAIGLVISVIDVRPRKVWSMAISGDRDHAGRDPRPDLRLRTAVGVHPHAAVRHDVDPAARLCGAFLPYGIVMSRSALLQVDPSLEESARMSGAGACESCGPSRYPLVKPTLIAILFLVMMQTVKEISASILLFTPQSQVLSTLAWQYVQAGDFQFAAAVGVVQTVMLIVLILATRFVVRPAAGADDRKGRRMTRLAIERLIKRFGDVSRPSTARPHDRLGQVRRPSRPERLRQDDDAALHRRPRGSDGRPDPDGWRAGVARQRPPFRPSSGRSAWCSNPMRSGRT